MRKTFALSLMLASVMSAAALADPLVYNGSLTLDQAIARVRDAGFDVRLSQADAESAHAQIAIAKAAALPQISLSGSTLKGNLPQLGMPIAQQTYLFGNATVPIVAKSQWLSAQAATIAARGSDISVSEARNDAAYAVIQTYHRAQLAIALVDARDVSVHAQQSHLYTTRLRVDAGKSPRYLLSRDRASLAVAQQELEDASAQRDQAMNDLKAVLDYGIDSHLWLADSLSIDEFNLDQSTALARAQVQRPALLASQRQLDAAQARARAAQAAYLPTITGNAQAYSGSSSPNLGATGYQVGITANLSVFDGGTRSAGIEQALAEIHHAQTEYDQLRLFTQRDVFNAYRELQAAATNLKSANATLADAKEQLRIAQLREAAGKGINLEVLDALAVAASARENVLGAIARYDNAVAGIRHAVGDLST